MLSPMLVNIYLPAPEETGIVGNTTGVGAGIVGTAREDGTLLIDFESNAGGYTNLVRYADRCRHAWDRQSTGHPTPNRMVVLPEEVVEVARFDTDYGEVHVQPGWEPAILTWVDCDEQQWQTERVSSIARHEMLRDLRQGLASDDQATVAKYEAWAARNNLVLPG